MKRNRVNCQKLIQKGSVITFFFAFCIFYSCQENEEIINVGYIGPLTTRATDLGIAPAKAIELAVEEYNNKRSKKEPKIKLFVEDDQWEKNNAMPAYKKLRKEHQIKVLFISNTDGTIAISQQAKEDNVIVVNPCNNDSILNKLNNNVFKIAKSTEEAHSVIAHRIIELNLKKVLILHYPNDFMTLGSATCAKILTEHGIENTVVSFEKGKTNYIKEFTEYKKEGYDAFVFFGYKEYGFAMKQARDLGITAKFFGSTVLLQEDYYENSQGAINGTEFVFFTPESGNYVLAQEFLNAYKLKYKETPFSVWPPMQAYDAANLVFNELKSYRKTKDNNIKFDDWLRNRLLNVRYYEGVCGNISIKNNGASSGIYFLLFKYTSKGKYVNIK
ncbi:MAG: amino acid ABC transporter substrate-binding protein [Flavobacteriaceae bacterium]|nr:amino acid ABC transporter substrate-binding protein [Flavobacteriaceae bacterium]